MTDNELDRYYLDLKGARERLCRAQTFAPPGARYLLQGAIDYLDLTSAQPPLLLKSPL